MSPARAERALALDARSRLGRDAAKVAQLQVFLGLPPVGAFDLPTVYTAAAFQQTETLAVDGIVGPNTRSALRGAGAFEQADSEAPGEEEVGAEETGEAETGEEVEAALPATPAQEAAIANRMAADAPAASGASEAQGLGSDDDLKERLERARAELGKVREKAYRGVPNLMKKRHAGKLRATLASKHPEKKLGEIRVWYAADAHSLERLEAYARSVGLGYSNFIARTGGGYAWCGSFIGQHYQLGAQLTYRKDGKGRTIHAGTALASTRKSYRFFNYMGAWKGAWIEDPTADDAAPVAERYQPLRAFHAAHGGQRQWLPIDGWKSNPAAVAKPGMVLFVNGKRAYGDHMIFVDRVEREGGGWRIHTVEGNAPGARTRALSYPISTSGTTVVKAVARPAALDFDASTRMIDQAMYERLLKES